MLPDDDDEPLGKPGISWMLPARPLLLEKDRVDASICFLVCSCINRE